MLSRKGNDMADRFPEILADVEAIQYPIIFDGELVMHDDSGRP